MNSRALHRTALCIAMGVCLASMLPVACAANNDGSIAGRVGAPAREVTVTNAETGFTRTVTADADGNYRFPFLPVGTYTVQASKDGAAVGAAGQGHRQPRQRDQRSTSARRD